MLWAFLFFLGTLLYMELVYHFGCFGFVAVNPVLAFPVWLLLAGLSALATGFLRRRKNRVIFWILLVVDYLLFASQLVYIKIFRQPLLIAAVKNAGKDAVTNYWKEALYAILRASGYLLLLAVPLAAAGFLLHFKALKLKSHTYGERLASISIMAGGLVLYIVALVGGYFRKTEYFESYSEFYDQKGVISAYGVTPSLVRDMFGDSFPGRDESLEVWGGYGDNDLVSTGGDVTPPIVEDDISGGDASLPEEVEPVLDTSPHVLPIDFESLIANTDSKEIQKLAEYMQSIPPTNKNEYTGMFAGYNLIYLTAEGFCPYAVDEELTPTLYRLVHSGFVFEDFYCPLWYTSTSDGEYANCTGLMPDNQMFSLKRSADVSMPFTLPSYFAAEGVKSWAFHDNSLSYYDRNRTHPNLGYNFMACKLGDLDEKVWGGQVFEMENANKWPASDLDMMVATIPYYINEDRFHVYYMTVSGHMYYSFSGNSMSHKHKDDVAELPYGEEGRAYIACHMELDLALEYLLEQLEAAGKLENTVICLSADHYPYAMEMSTLEELAGKPLDGTLEIYRNNLILWNSEMETVNVEKTAYSLDILPTLLNLFGFEYDSRLYVGRDILSDSLPLVVFSDRSFITDRIIYNRKGSVPVMWRDGTEEDEEYHEAMKKQVKGLVNYSSGILNNDFYRYVEEALPEEYRSQIDPEWIAPHPPGPKPTPLPDPNETPASETEQDTEQDETDAVG